MIKSGAKKTAKTSFEPQSVAEQGTYIAQQMKNAVAKLEEYKKRGDEAGIKRTEGIIKNLEEMENRRLQRSRN